MIRATVHWECVYINGSPVDLSRADVKRLCKALLDAGFRVRGFWKDIDYCSIDSRIEKGVN